MAEQLAILGGKLAITLDHKDFSQWPIYGEEEVEVVSKLIREDKLSSSHPDPEGPIVKLEQAIMKRWGVKHALAHSSGTAALRAALFGVGVLPGDEVIVQSAVHPFNCLPIIGCDAVPVFADIEPNGLTLDPKDVERKITPRTKAIMVVHWHGMPADMDAIMAIARKHNLKVVEDNCVSQGTTHRGRMCGTIGDAGAISLQDGKLTSAGEGGVFMTNDDEVYMRAASLGHYERLREFDYPKWQGVSGFSFGEKYRIATITAAIGVVQMKYWSERFEVRRENGRKLGRAISEINGFSAPPVPDYVESPYDRGNIVFDPKKLGGITREKLIKALQAEGAKVSSPARKDTRIPHTNLVRALHMHPVFAGNEHGTGDILWEVLGTPEKDRPKYGKGTLPVTEDMELPYNTVHLPIMTKPADPLIAQYEKAFDKVAMNAKDLAKASI
ncbi:MAG: DegT/DnrJ/EryC1/StrS family aminotransferase [SAR202 cluster bacterium]|nr:DegT/DnrJ/EryC1/StrS family aminotransferase [SAR202 cluster bacterium]